MKNSGNFKNSGKLDNGYSYCYSDMHSYTKDNKFELSMLMLRNNNNEYYTKVNDSSSTVLVKIDKENNVVKSCDDDTLVGSCCTMLDIFNSLINVLNVPVGKAFMMLSENPAR
jgi:hypothetical protein